MIVGHVWIQERMLEGVFAIVSLDAGLALFLDSTDIVGNLSLHDVDFVVDVHCVVQRRHNISTDKGQSLFVVRFGIVFQAIFVWNPVHVFILFDDGLTFSGALTTHLSPSLVSLSKNRPLRLTMLPHLVAEIAGCKLIDQAILVLKALLCHVKRLLHGHGESGAKA